MHRPPFSENRPGWWPENEPWPPTGRHARFRRGHFFRRIGVLFVFLNFIFVGIIVLIINVVGHYLGFLDTPIRGPWMIPVTLLSILIGLSFLSTIGRRLRAMSAPFGDLVSAADRVAEKDYSVRVEEKGPSEVRSLARAFNSMAVRLETHDKNRRNLLADVSHELRTPLTVIQGNVEGMLDGVYPADEAHLKAILEQSQVLSRLVDDLRTLALAESGSLALRREPTDLAVLVSETAASFQAEAQAAGVTVAVRIAGELPLIDVDPVRIREVLTNLIANALRYSPTGQAVTIRLEQAARQDRTYQVVGVEDHGKGVSAEDLPHIFDRFYKTRDSSGLGLGLSIARSLVETHEGWIEAESPASGGTLIRVGLPEDAPVT